MSNNTEPRFEHRSLEGSKLREIPFTNEDFKKLYTQNDRINYLTLNLIREFAPDVLQLPSFKNSPIAENADTLTENLMELQNNFTASSQSPSRIRTGFSNSWRHYLSMLEVPLDATTSGIEVSLKALSLIKSPNTKIKPSGAFSDMMRREKKMMIKKLLAPRKAIVGEGGVYNNTTHLKKEQRTYEKGALTLQLGLAKAVLCYLNNQSTMSGFMDGKKYDTGNTAKVARNLLDRILTNGWTRILPPRAKIFQELNDHCKDFEQGRHFDTHDQNITFDEKGEYALQQFNLEKDGLSALPVRIFSSDGSSYFDTNVTKVLSLNSFDLINILSKGESDSLAINWKSIKADHPNDTIKPLFALSLSSKEHPNPSLPASGGEILYHLHLDVDSSTTQDILTLNTAHAKDDAIDQAWTLEQIGNSLPRTKITPDTSDIINIKNEKTDEIGLGEKIAKAKNAQDLLNILNLVDSTVGTTFNQEQFNKDIKKTNAEKNRKANEELTNYITANPRFEVIMKQLVRAYELDNTGLNEQQISQLIIKNFQSLLNPAISRVDIIGMVSEKQTKKLNGSTTICNYPISFLRRLTLSLIKTNSIARINRESSKNDLDSLWGDLKKTAEDRALSKLGLGPLAFLTVFTSEAQKLAENVASILKKATVDKTQVMTQISDIRDAGKGWFKSALSGYRKSLARSIGITQNRVTSRVDLTSLDFVNTLELSKELDGTTIDWISNLITPDTTNPDTLEPDPSARLKTRFELTLINKYIQDIAYSTTNNLSSEELLAKILQKIKREIPPTQKSLISGLRSYLISKQYTNLVDLIAESENIANIMASNNQS